MLTEVSCQAPCCALQSVYHSLGKPGCYIPPSRLAADPRQQQGPQMCRPCIQSRAVSVCLSPSTLIKQVLIMRLSRVSRGKAGKPHSLLRKHHHILGLQRNRTYKYGESLRHSQQPAPRPQVLEPLTIGGRRCGVLRLCMSRCMLLAYMVVPTCEPC